MNDELTPSDFDGFQTYEQYRDAEIERLKRINVSLVAQERGFREEIERLQFLNKEERETIEELSRLCTRAADALEQHQMVTGEIIAELRKAAE